MSQNIFHHHSFSKTTHRLFLKRALPSVFKATFLEGELFTISEKQNITLLIWYKIQHSQTLQIETSTFNLQD